LGLVFFFRFWVGGLGFGGLVCLACGVFGGLSFGGGGVWGFCSFFVWGFFGGRGGVVYLLFLVGAGPSGCGGGGFGSFFWVWGGGVLLGFLVFFLVLFDRFLTNSAKQLKYLSTFLCFGSLSQEILTTQSKFMHCPFHFSLVDIHSGCGENGSIVFTLTFPPPPGFFLAATLHPPPLCSCVPLARPISP